MFASGVCRVLGFKGAVSVLIGVYRSADELQGLRAGLSLRLGKGMQGLACKIWGFPKIGGTLFGGPYSKDPTI